MDSRHRSWRREIVERVAKLNLRPEREAEIVEEVAQHLDDRYRELRASGRSDEDAAASAWRELDETDVLAREIARVEVRAPLDLPPPGAPARGRWLGALWQDARYAARTLHKSPGFTLTVVFAIALSIGPTTAILSIGNWLLWRPHPGVADSDRLAEVWFGTWRGPTSVSPSGVSYEHLADITNQSTTSTGLSGVQGGSVSVSIPGTLSRSAGTASVTATFFDVLGVRMRAGRAFLPDDDHLSASPVAVISEGMARASFGGPEAALGKSVLLNSRPFTVVGVAPAAFAGISPTGSVDVWIPGATSGYMAHSPEPRLPSFYSFVARLAPGAAFSDLESELNVLARGLAEQSPAENEKFTTVQARVFPRLGIMPLTRPRTQRMVATMLAVGAVLLLLGCANVANLLVFRTTRRQHEIAVRKALGASGWRLVQVQMMESCLLALTGAALGLALAVLLKQLMQQLLFPAPAGMSLTVPIDGRVLAITIVAAIATGLVSAAAPAWLATRGRSLTAAVPTGSRASTRAPSLRGALASLQLALSLTLLVGALLLVTTLRNLRAVDLGLDPAGITTLSVDLGDHGYTPERARQYFRTVLLAFEGHGEFDGVALAYRSPFGSLNSARVGVPGGDSGTLLRTGRNAVTHDYFHVLSIPFLRGRTFTSEESFAARVYYPVIVNETLARSLYGTLDAIGARIHVEHLKRDLQVIGVVADSRWSDVTDEAEPFLYEPLGGSGRTSAEFLLRSSLPVARLRDVAGTIAARTDSSVPFSLVRPLTDKIDRRLSEERLFAWMLSLLAALGFLLASLGLYGLVAQTTTERRREFGIRMAVGAGRADIIRLVARYAFVVSAAGVVAGLGLAWFGTRMVSSMLFGVSRLDPMVYAAAVGTLILVVVLACVVPTLRALRVQPVEVLRAE